MSQKVNKLLLLFGICALAILLIKLFWKHPFILALLLISLQLGKHYLLPIKKEFLFYIITSLLGAFGESFIMLSGPWIYTSIYTNIHILNFPIWLPFLWGLAGTTGVSIYESIL